MQRILFIILNQAIGCLLAALCLAPIVEETVDLVEVNHYYDEAGKHVFDQLIFYDWVCADERYHVIAWRLIKQPAQYPRRNHRGQYDVTWQDGDDFRLVRARQYRETWTQYDPELLERAHRPKEQRRELLRPPTHGE